jgi:glycosyltransferase involved in cell wall biosynthesis
MRVLLTSTDNPYVTRLGGKHIHLLLLERGLKASGVEVTILYYNPQSLVEFVKRSILKLFPERTRYKTKLNLMINYLRKHIPKEQFDIIHAHDVLSILATSSTPQKRVLTLHGYFARENIEFVKNEKDRKAIYPILFQLEKNAMKLADYVVAVDQRLKNYVTSEFRYPTDKIEIMHNAVDTDNFSPSTEEQQRALKKELGFDAESFVVMVPRRLVEKNGVVYAVRAMKHLKKENLRMLIAGDGPERSQITKEAEDDSRIRIAGTIPHEKIAPYYRMVDIVLIPSITSHGIQEATSLSMLEAMACGKVAICSNIGGMREIVQNMETGILTEEKQPEEIAKAIETTIENPDLRSKIGNEARKYVLRNHSFTAHANKVSQIYRTVLGENKNA